jgi:hypothetical protein
MQLITLKIDLTGLQSITDPAEMLEEIRGFMLPMIIVLIVNLLFTTIMHYYIIFSPIDSNVTMLTSIFSSLKYFIPYLVMVILLSVFGSVAIVAGFFALVIGMFFAFLYLMMLYLLILPILMLEGNNIALAIGRTFRLAHNGFWSNIGWVTIFFLIIIVISLVAAALINIPFAGNMLKSLSGEQDPVSAVAFIKNPVFIALSSIVNALFFPLMPIFGVILYFNGRAKEDGARVVQESNEPPKVTVEDLYAKPRDGDQQ